jgi:hypothetical protein
VRGFKTVAFGAIVGMAYPALAKKGMKTVFDNLIDQNSLTNNMFSFYIVD